MPWNGCSKLEYSRRIAGTLAYLAVEQGDAVGLFCAAKRFEKTIPPNVVPLIYPLSWMSLPRQRQPEKQA